MEVEGAVNHFFSSTTLSEISESVCAQGWLGWGVWALPQNGVTGLV